MRNIAYIDGQNVYLGIKTLGYSIDWKIFFEYLQKRYEIAEVKIFIGHVERYQGLYNDLRSYGYTLIFRKTQLQNGVVKGNVDSAMVLEAVRDFYVGHIQNAYLVSGDGDFDVLIDFFENEGKLGKLLCPNIKKASKLLKQATPRNKIQDMATILHIIGKKNT